MRIASTAKPNTGISTALRKDLNLAVQREEYERAAQLRDKIKSLDPAGLTPGSAGLYQITFQMPSSLSSNQVDLLVMQNGRSANPTKLPATP